MKIKLIFFLVVSSFLLKANNGKTFEAPPTLSVQELAEQTNLVLRQLGHELLQIGGNDSSTVRPIQQPEEHVFLLSFPDSFYYDTLPFLLHSTLSGLDMEAEPYFVAVKDCASDTMILGYDVRQFLAGKVPCIGRAQYAACNNIYVNFPNRKIAQSLQSEHPLYLLLAGIFLISGIYFWVTSRKTKPMSPKILSVPTDTKQPPNQLIKFGNSQMDLTNQLLYIQGVKNNLTYREAKLLHYFVRHANQLLNRSDILDQVWGDEGIVVGRSLDVFVSRLRKLLKPDSTLQIKTVHGIGYRLEINSR